MPAPGALKPAPDPDCGLDRSLWPLARGNAITACRARSGRRRSPGTNSLPRGARTRARFAGGRVQRAPSSNRRVGQAGPAPRGVGATAALATPPHSEAGRGEVAAPALRALPGRPLPPSGRANFPKLRADRSAPGAGTEVVERGRAALCYRWGPRGPSAAPSGTAGALAPPRALPAPPAGRPKPAPPPAAGAARGEGESRGAPPGPLLARPRAPAQGQPSPPRAFGTPGSPLPQLSSRDLSAPPGPPGASFPRSDARPRSGGFSRSSPGGSHSPAPLPAARRPGAGALCRATR